MQELSIRPIPNTVQRYFLSQLQHNGLNIPSTIHRCFLFRKFVIFSSLFLATPVSAAVPEWISNLSKSEDNQVKCVALAVYFESRDQSERGQRAVAHVVVNRSRDGRYAPTPCAVLYQPGQFTFIGRRSLVVRETKKWEKALEIARDVMNGAKDITNGCLNFRQRHMRKNGLFIEGHVFFR